MAGQGGHFLVGNVSLRVPKGGSAKDDDERARRRERAQVPDEARARAFPRRGALASEARRPDRTPVPRDDRVPGLRSARDPRVRRRHRGERGPDRDAEAPKDPLACRSDAGGPDACARARATRRARARKRAGCETAPVAHHPSDRIPAGGPAHARRGGEGPQACPRGLRRSQGVVAVTASVSLPTVAAVLGRASLPTTAIYTTAIGAEAREHVSRAWT